MGTHSTREELLAYIAKIKAEREVAKTCGELWRMYDHKARRSAAAGKLCEAVRTLAKANEKAARNNPGSIGYRKGKAHARKARRMVRDLEAIIAQPLEDYYPPKPLQLTQEQLLAFDACGNYEGREPAWEVRRSEYKTFVAARDYIVT